MIKNAGTVIILPLKMKGGIEPMEFQQFKDVVVEGLKKIYPNATVSLASVKKNNGIELDGVVIREEGQNISPNIYLQNWFSMAASGEDIDVVINRISRCYEEHKVASVADEFISSISDYSAVGNRIYCILINAEKNQELLKECPHRKMLDLAIVYRINVEMFDGTVGSILIRNEMMKMWKVTEQEIYSAAENNTKSLFESTIQNINEVLIEMMHGRGCSDSELMDAIYNFDIENHMLVVTNRYKTNGAGVIFLDKEVQENVSEIMGGDFVIIPSSIHETICTDMGDIDAIKAMVQDVNSTQVSAEEVLSDSVYFYNSKEKEIQIAI